MALLPPFPLSHSSVHIAPSLLVVAGMTGLGSPAIMVHRRGTKRTTQLSHCLAGHNMSAVGIFLQIVLPAQVDIKSTCVPREAKQVQAELPRTLRELLQNRNKSITDFKANIKAKGLNKDICRTMLSWCETCC